jgi:hypothetical protein
MLHHVIWYKFTSVSEVLAASIIALIMEAASTSETSVNFYQTTWHNIPEDSHLHGFWSCYNILPISGIKLILTCSDA